MPMDSWNLSVGIRGRTAVCRAYYRRVVRACSPPGVSADALAVLVRGLEEHGGKTRAA